MYLVLSSKVNKYRREVVLIIKISIGRIWVESVIKLINSNIDRKFFIYVNRDVLFLLLY